jgi:hypothetical protein
MYYFFTKIYVSISFKNKLFLDLRACRGPPNFRNFADCQNRLSKFDGTRFAKHVKTDLKQLSSKIGGRPIILFGMLPIGPCPQDRFGMGALIDKFILLFQAYFLAKWEVYAQENIFFYECANVPEHVKDPAFFGADNRPNHLYLRAVNSLMAPTARAVSMGHHRSFSSSHGMKAE